MCPDRELLSAYLDDEVPSPWKERFEAQIAADPECNRILEELAAVRDTVRHAPEPDFVASQSTVWRRIGERRPIDRPAPAWRRRLAVPVPVAAAAASLFFVLAGALIWHTARATVGPVELPVTGHDTELVIRIGEMSIDELLQILNAGDSVGELTVKLPENARFNYLGEPRMLRAADFRREEPLLVPLAPIDQQTELIAPQE